MSTTKKVLYQEDLHPDYFTCVDDGGVNKLVPSVPGTVVQDRIENLGTAAAPDLSFAGATAANEILVGNGVDNNMDAKALACGEVLMGADGNTVDCICPFPVFSNVRDSQIFSLDTNVTPPTATSGVQDTYVTTYNHADIPAPPFALPSCLKWVAWVPTYTYFGLQTGTFSPGFQMLFVSGVVVNGVLPADGGINSTTDVVESQINGPTDNVNFRDSRGYFHDINQTGPTPVAGQFVISFENTTVPRPVFTNYLTLVSYSFFIAKA